MTGSDKPAWNVALSQTERAGIAYTHQVFNNADELTAFLAAAEKNNTAVIPAAPGRIPPAVKRSSLAYVDLSRFVDVVEHARADQVVNVQTGMTVHALQTFLAEHKQWWPVYVPEEWTVFETIVRGDGGALDYRFGGPRDLTLGMNVALAAGNVIKCGGKVVKNVTGFDMTKLFVGSRGSLGLPISAWLRLYALPQASVTIFWSAAEGKDAIRLSQALIASGLPLSCLKILSDKCLQSLSAGEELADLQSLASNGLLVVAQVHGIADVVAQVVQSARAVSAAGVSLQNLELSGRREQAFWRRLTELALAENGTGWLHINCPMSLMNVVFHTLGSETSWQARPASGRINVQLGGRDAKQMVERLTAGRPADEPVIVAFADDEFNYRVRYLPHEDQSLHDLKMRLQDKLDPSGILNPFVSL